MKKENELELLITNVLSRCTTPNGMTDESIEAVIVMEKEISIHKAMADLLLNGHMVAEYNGLKNKSMELDNFVFKMTPEGKKYVESKLKPGTKL